MSETKRTSLFHRRHMRIAIALGVVAGAAVGVALENIVGLIAVGAAVGAGIGIFLYYLE